MDFRVLHATHFNIYFYSLEKDDAEMVARMAERWYKRAPLRAHLKDGL